MIPWYDHAECQAILNVWLHISEKRICSSKADYTSEELCWTFLPILKNCLSEYLFLPSLSTRHLPGGQRLHVPGPGQRVGRGRAPVAFLEPGIQPCPASIAGIRIIPYHPSCLSNRVGEASPRLLLDSDVPYERRWGGAWTEEHLRPRIEQWCIQSESCVWRKWQWTLINARRVKERGYGGMWRTMIIERYSRRW